MNDVVSRCFFVLQGEIIPTLDSTYGINYWQRVIGQAHGNVVSDNLIVMS